MRRELTPELMDDPEIEPGEHRRALAGLARLNRLSVASGPVWRGMRRFARGLGRPVRVLDVATGSGDVAVGLARRARRGGVEVDLTASDISVTALAASVERAERAGVRLRALEHDVFAGPLPGRYDVVMCSLFLHHLDEEGAALVLARMRGAADGLVLASDLVRDRVGLAMAFGASRAFTRSRVVHVDAVKSVRAAFTVHELRALASEAGMGAARVVRVWPRRMLLRWSRSSTPL